MRPTSMEGHTMDQSSRGTAVRPAGAALLAIAATIHVALISQYPLPVLQTLFALSALGLAIGAAAVAEVQDNIRNWAS